MKLFDKYVDELSEIINKNEYREYSNIVNLKTTSYFEKEIANENLELQQTNSENKVLIDFDKSQLINLFGNNPNSFLNNTIGTHPDFEHIKHHSYEKHYSVSMFIDIKGSTRLVEKYSILEIRKIKDTILTLAIHVASHFGGHIHRMQGDGIFIQFVRKDLKEQDSVINALNSASILTHFISTDLASIFKNNEVHPLSIRTGIDLGFKEDTIWSHYGVPGCAELTTTGLHTDLASKLQSNATSNGILIGGNIKDILDLNPVYCKDVKKENNEVDYYIYQGIKNYRKFSFNWLKYLDSFNFTKIASSGSSLEIEIPNIRLICYTTDKNGDSIEYYQNSMIIQKGTKIKYYIKENDSHYNKKNFETIEWTAFNSGKEAKDATQEKHNFGGANRNKNFCETTAQYKGHHYVECLIKREHSKNMRFTFPIFVE